MQIGEVAEIFWGLNQQELTELLIQRPVSVMVSTTGWDTYASGILSCGQWDVIDHAVLLVGYDASSWIIKNSWGDTWG